MELISREAVKQAVRDKFKDLPTRCEINEVINLIPTIEERKEGYWIRDGHHIRCSECSEYICDKDREGDTIPQNYCPNCGAEMKGE